MSWKRNEKVKEDNMPSKEEPGVIEGIIRSPSYLEQSKQTMKLFTKERVRMEQFTTNIRKIRIVILAEWFAKYFFMGAMATVGAQLLSIRYGVQELFYLFVAMFVFGLWFFFWSIGKIRSEYKTKWSYRFSIYFNEQEREAKRNVLKQNQTYRSEDAKIHNHYNMLINEARETGTKQGITIGKEMIEEEFKDEINTYRQQMMRQATELDRIKHRFAGKTEAECLDCPNRRDFGILLTDTEAILEPPKPIKKKVKFDV